MSKAANKVKNLKRKLFNKQKGLCVYCFNPMTFDKDKNNQPYARTITIDHIIPLAKQGSNSKDNKVACCSKCNNAKGNKIINRNKSELIAGVANGIGDVFNTVCYLINPCCKVLHKPLGKKVNKKKELNRFSYTVPKRAITVIHVL